MTHRGFNALAESVIGVYKTEVIRRKGPWRTLEAVEFATLTWVDWFNTRRLLGPLGTFHQQSSRRSTMSRLRWPDSTNSVSDVPGTIHFEETRELDFSFGVGDVARFRGNLFTSAGPSPRFTA